MNKKSTVYIVIILLIAVLIIICNGNIKSKKEAYIINGQGNTYFFKVNELDKLNNYILVSLEKKDKADRVKYLYSNSFIYYDMKGKKHSFKFTEPSLVKNEKESIIFIDDESFKINIEFYEKLNDIVGSSINLNVD